MFSVILGYLLLFVNHDCFDTSIRTDIGFLYGNQFELAFNFRLRHVLDGSFVSHMRNILGAVFNLLVIRVRDMNRRVIGMLNGSVVGHFFSHFNILADGSCMGFDILSFIRDSFIRHMRFIIDVIFLNRHVFILDTRTLYKATARLNNL